MSRAGSLYTVGHSTRTIDALLDLLHEHAIVILVDVRRHPGSRRHPQFGQRALAASLAAAGIEYVHEPELGGRRVPARDSPNTGLTSLGFRGYADHMTTAEFRAALDRVIAAGQRAPTVLMCAEAVPWRCHRQLIADGLVARAIPVLHLLGPGRTERHRLSLAAQLAPDGNLTYPARAAPQIRLFDGG